MLRLGLGQFVLNIAGSPSLPSLADLAQAYQEVGLIGASTVLTEAVRRMESNPEVAADLTTYADLHVRLKKELASSPRLMTAYIRKNLAAFVSVPLSANVKCRMRTPVSGT